jgi:CubicO group peptidase (beta-lactamase class C family)
MPFDAFLRERLFEPLGMEDTYFYLPEEKADRMVTPHMGKDGEWVKYRGVPDYYDSDYPIKGAKTYFSGGAGLSSTAYDYATFLQMILNDGELNGIRFLSRTTVDTMNAIQIEMGGGPTSHSLAFGVTNEKSVAKGGLGSEGTFGWGGYFNSQYFVDPEEQILAVLLKQTKKTINRDSTGGKYRRLVLQSIDD